jgi:hypothetical protein
MTGVPYRVESPLSIGLWEHAGSHDEKIRQNAMHNLCEYPHGFTRRMRGLIGLAWVVFERNRIRQRAVFDTVDVDVDVDESESREREECRAVDSSPPHPHPKSLRPLPLRQRRLGSSASSPHPLTTSPGLPNTPPSPLVARGSWLMTALKILRLTVVIHTRSAIPCPVGLCGHLVGGLRAARYANIAVGGAWPACALRSGRPRSSRKGNDPGREFCIATFGTEGEALGLSPDGFLRYEHISE